MSRHVHYDNLKYKKKNVHYDKLLDYDAAVVKTFAEQQPQRMLLVDPIFEEASHFC